MSHLRYAAAVKERAEDRSEIWVVLITRPIWVEAQNPYRVPLVQERPELALAGSSPPVGYKRTWLAAPHAARVAPGQ